MPDTHYEEILEKQIAMNRQTWAALQKHGVTEESQLRSEFSFDAPSRQAADRLCALLQEQTDYNAKVESGGSFLRRQWRVEGRTQNTAVSPAILDQWVTWMISAGKEQSCDFDWTGNVSLGRLPRLKWRQQAFNAQPPAKELVPPGWSQGNPRVDRCFHAELKARPELEYPATHLRNTPRGIFRGSEALWLWR